MLLNRYPVIQHVEKVLLREGFAKNRYWAQRQRLFHEVTIRVSSYKNHGSVLRQIRRGEQVFSELRSRPAPVLWANSPHDSFTVELELQLPNATTPLPQRTPLVVSPAPEQPAAVPAAGEDASGEAAAKKTPGEAWKGFSPRSRVPKGQMENLDRRDRFW